MSAEPVRRRKNRKTNTSLGIPHTFSFPLLPTHECRAVNLHMMTLKILFHMDVKWGSRPHGIRRESKLVKWTRTPLYIHVEKDFQSHHMQIYSPTLMGGQESERKCVRNA